MPVGVYVSLYAGRQVRPGTLLVLVLFSSAAHLTCNSVADWGMGHSLVTDL